MKNRLINSGMVIDQRATTLTDYGYATDRWSYAPSTSGKASVAQSSTAPTGFKNSLLSTSSAATTIGSTDLYIIEQKIEGYNIADLGWGTANAKTVTLSFWVRSSLTGTFGGGFSNAAYNRGYPFTYTISAANTWEYKTVTVAGDTTGTWGTTNGLGIELVFSLGMGSSLQATPNAWTNAWRFPTGAVSVVSTNGATLYITGVQLEVGTVATSFDFRSYSTELALCQRYYWRGTGIMSGAAYLYGAAGSNYVLGDMASFGTVMRAQPTVTQIGTPTYSNCSLWDIAASTNGFAVRVNVTSSGTYRIDSSSYAASIEL
jgi:hypothetical protein